MGKIRIKIKTLEAMRATPGVVEQNNGFGIPMLKCRPYPSFPLSWAPYLCGHEYEVAEDHPIVSGVRISGWMVESKEMRFEDLYLKLKS